jgi:hypothetical protein
MLYFPAPFGRVILIFEKQTFVFWGNSGGAEDKGLGLALSIGVALGDDGAEDRGLQLSITDSALSMAAAIADDSARA